MAKIIADAQNFSSEEFFDFNNRFLANCFSHILSDEEMTLALRFRTWLKTAAAGDKEQNSGEAFNLIENLIKKFVGEKDFQNLKNLIEVLDKKYLRLSYAPPSIAKYEASEIAAALIAETNYAPSQSSPNIFYLLRNIICSKSC